MALGPKKHGNVPDRIPDAPDVDVDFDALEERTTIGSGGTADVVEATVSGTDAVVAVKRPRLENTLGSDVAERFVAEAETWAKLDGHENVVGVVDWGADPIPWIALEYMDGGSLRERIGDCSLERNLWIGTQVADGIRAAHRRGVAHLDLKPDNVLFRATEGTAWDVPKVSDWGLAKVLLDRSQPMDGISPTYAAPEQLDADEYGSPDDLSDVYQLGVIVYETVTGTPPFTGRPTAIVTGHLTEAPRPPTDLDPSLPSAIDDVIGTALEKSKADRYESILDFRRDLASVFEHVAFGNDPTLIADGDVWSGRSTTGASTARSNGRDPSPTTTTERGNSGTVTDDDAGRSFGKGSSFGSGNGPRVLDRIREESAEAHEQEFPWQYRDDPPGLDRDRGADGKSTSDDRSHSTTPNLADDGNESSESKNSLDESGLVVWWVLGGVAAAVGLLANVPLVTILGVGIAAAATMVTMSD